MALLSPQTPTITGLTPTYANASASDTVRYTGNGRMFLICRNTSASPNTATVVVPGTERGQQIPDVAVTVPITNGERWIGPLDAGMKDANGVITVTNSSPGAGVTVALVVL